MTKPTDLAIISGTETITYGQLQNYLHDLRTAFETSRALRSEKVILINEKDDIGFILKCMAAVQAGRRILPVPPSMSGPTRLQLLEQLDKLEPFDTTSRGGLVYMTSGSTGASKLVMRSWASLEEEARSVYAGMGIEVGHRVLVTTPLAHSFGFGMAMATLWAGGTLLAPKGHFQTKVHEIFHHLRSGVAFMTGVPFVFKALLRGATPTAGTVRCFAGGEPMPASLPARWEAVCGSPLRAEYGLSEVGICSISQPGAAPQSIGWPLPDVTFTLTHEHELIAKRKHSPVSYYFGESPDTFTKEGTRTGDHATKESDGFHFVGRLGTVINVAGMKVLPSEIEKHIRRYPGIDEVAVVGRPHGLRGEVPTAFITKGYDVDVYGLRKYLADRLDSYKVPRIRVVEELPRTPTGKVDRESLRSL